MTTKEKIAKDVKYVSDLFAIACNPEWVDCEYCGGKGRDAKLCEGYSIEWYDCEHCNGTGKVNKHHDILNKGAADIQARLIAYHAAMAVVASKKGVKMYRKMLDKFMKDYINE